MRTNVDTIGIDCGQPTSPVDLETLKAHLAVDGPALDSLISTIYLPAAVEWAEDYMQRSIIARVHTWSIRNFPNWRNRHALWEVVRGFNPYEIRLPRGKTLSVDNVTYTDGDGEHQLVGPTSGSPGADYQENLTNESGGLIRPLVGQVWPQVLCDELAPVKITFTAGWETADDVPARIKQALFVAVTDMLELRGSTDMVVLSNLLINGKTTEFRETLISDFVIRVP